MANRYALAKQGARATPFDLPALTAASTAIYKRGARDSIRSPLYADGWICRGNPCGCPAIEERHVTRKSSRVAGEGLALWLTRLAIWDIITEILKVRTLAAGATRQAGFRERRLELRHGGVSYAGRRRLDVTRADWRIRCVFVW